MNEPLLESALLRESIHKRAFERTAEVGVIGADTYYESYGVVVGVLLAGSPASSRWRSSPPG